MDIPNGVYLINRTLENVESSLPQDAKHLCIDKSELCMLVLRITLGLQGVLPSEAPKIFGWFSQSKNQFYFLNETQHSHIKLIKNESGITC